MSNPWDPASRFQLDALREQIDLRNDFADAADLGIAEQVGKLLRVCRAQQMEIEQLRLSQQLLVQMLSERGVIDFTALQMRYQQAEQAARPTPQQPEAPRQTTVRCAACGAEVDRRSTYLTGQGAVCGACHSA